MEGLSHSNEEAFMEHNTSTLGYKVLSGQLKESRKHSEQLNKYLAGYLDADGCMSITFRPYNGYYTPSLTFHFQQSLSVDPDGSLVKAIKEFYNIGAINYRDLVGQETSSSSVVVWTMGTSDFLKLFSLVGKHLRIKGTHWENLIWLYNELKLFRLSETNIEELRDFSKCSRKNSKWLKHPKHLSYAWLAGYLDGDGHYRFRQRRKYFKREDKFCNSNELSIHLSCDINDKHIVSKLVEDFGGSTHLHKQGHLVWVRSLGKNSYSFAVPFLKMLRKFSCLEKKYLVIDNMLQFHSDHQQRLNMVDSKE